MRSFRDEALFATVGRHCALPIDLFQQRLPEVEVAHALDLLREQGFDFLTPDPVATAMDWVDKAMYKHAAPMSQAPDYVDCSGFVKWVYGRWGMRLPRFSIQQSRLGMNVGKHQLLPGDLVFSLSAHNRRLHGDFFSVGHAGMYLDDHTVVHASRDKGRVTLATLDEFWRAGFAGARRILPYRMVTAVIPEDWEVESADHLICNVYDLIRRKNL